MKKNKRIKRILASMMVWAMAFTMLSACGRSEDASTSHEGSESGTATEDMKEINVMIMSLSAVGEGKQEVEDAVNEITEKEINTHVTLTYVESGSYAQQLSLAITADEKVDLCVYVPTAGASFSSLESQNQLIGLNDLLDEYAPDIKEVMGDLIKGTTVDGTIYGIPVNRDMSTKDYIVARKDLLESSGQLDAFNNMETWTDYENVLKEVTTKNDIAGVCNGNTEGSVCYADGSDNSSDNFADNKAFDTLGDSYKIIYTDDNGNVQNFFETEAYQKIIERARKFYEEGLVYKDAATAQDYADSLIKSNVAFSVFTAAETNVVASKTASTGYEVVVKPVAEHSIDTAACQKFGWGIPVCAKEEEAAAKFLNLMYTNEDIVNLLTWGVEGRDYVVENGVANYPEGISPSNVQYHLADFLIGNEFLAYPWGSTADEREIAKEAMDATPVSQYLGFCGDTSNVANELTAIQNVLGQYQPGLESGTADNYDEFIEALKAAGVDKVVDEYQKQLDEWIAAQ